MKPNLFEVYARSPNDQIYPKARVNAFGNEITRVGSKVTSIKIIQYNSICLVIEKGRKWADFMECYEGPPFFVVSEKVVNDLQVAGLKEFDAKPINIEKIKSGKMLQKNPPPNYFSLKAKPGIELDREANEDLYEQCMNPEIDTSHLGPGLLPENVVTVESWNGNSIFTFSNAGEDALLVDERFLNLSRDKEWTNVTLRPLNLI